MHLSSQAKIAFSSGNYHRAMELYGQAIAEQPELSHLYLISLNIIRKKLGLPPTHLNAVLQAPPEVSETSLCSARTSSKLGELFFEVTASDNYQITIPPSHQPSVSVLMAVHNCSNVIEQSITSLLRQTWQNIEIIVVDLASNDTTWMILQRLRRTVSTLKCYRLNTMQGAPYGLNHALNQASGDYIFFQGSHDFSHPDRIRLSMLKLMSQDVAAVRGSAIELNSTTGPVQESNVYEILTLGLRRSVFEQTGSLPLTILSGEEYLQRLYTWSNFNKLRVIVDIVPAYYRIHPLSYENLVVQSITQADSNIIETYRQSFRKAHLDIDPSHFKDAFRFPSRATLVDTPTAISQKFEPPLPVVVNICSIPERETLLKQTLNSLSPQVDQINIYLDRYNKIPDFLDTCHPHIRIFSSTEHPNLRDNGKFLSLSENIQDCYYFTADDDLIYPPDYVESLVKCIEKYSRQVVVGLHGILLPEHPAGYFSSYRKVHSFDKELERDVLVNILGTGTVAFHSHLMRGLNVNYFKKPGMADLYFSIFCKDRRIPMVSLARPEEWLKELPSPNTSLYQEFKQSDEDQTYLVKSRSPWGYASIKQAISSLSSQDSTRTVSSNLEKMIPSMWECLK